MNQLTIDFQTPERENYQHLLQLLEKELLHREFKHTSSHMLCNWLSMEKGDVIISTRQSGRGMEVLKRTLGEEYQHEQWLKSVLQYTETRRKIKHETLGIALDENDLKYLLKLI